MSETVPPADNLPPPPRRRGVVAVILREQRLLVIQRSLLVAAPGAYCFPGGGIEPGESEPQALVRELHEELSLHALPVREIWRHTTSWGVELGWWLAAVDDFSTLVPNPAEVQQVGWHTLAELDALPGLLESNRRFVAAVRTGEVAIDHAG